MPPPAPLSAERRAEILDYVSGRHSDITPVLNEEGWDFVVAIADDLVYRFPRSESAAEALRTEVAFLGRFASLTPVHVPTPELIDEPLHSIYALIPGDPLTPDTLRSWSSSDRARAAEVLGVFLSALHAIPVTEALGSGLRPDAWAISWWEPSSRALCLDEVPLLDHRLRTLAERTIAAAEPATLRAPREAAIHNDLAPEHILSAGSAITGIIDFGDVAFGDPALDFQWATIYRDGGVEDVEAFVGGVFDHYEHTVDDAFLARVDVYRAYHALRNIRDEHRFGKADRIRSAIEQFERAAQRLDP